MVLEFVALGLISVFYAAYFTKQMMLRRRGIMSNRLARGVKPRRTARIEGWLLVLTVITALVQYASVFLRDHMVSFVWPMYVNWVGVGILGAGVGIFILAMVQMRDSWRAGVDEDQRTRLVTTGVYALSRNPAFLGFDLMYLGTTLALPNAVMAAFAVGTIIVLHMQILEEERFLPSVFGDDYLRYRAATPRYLWVL